MVSFIVPAYNEEAELPATLRAITAAAEAERCSYEIVLVNDASTDRTPVIGESFGARVVTVDRRQIAAARNAGARTARGSIFIFVDADTHIVATHVREVIDALAQGVAGGSARLAIDREVPTWGKISFRIFSAIYFGLNFGAGAFLFTTRANYFASGGFDERYFAGEEVFFTLALKKIGRFKLLRPPVITSGRKLRMYSGWTIWKRVLVLLCSGPRAAMSRKHLDIWYGGERE